MIQTICLLSCVLAAGQATDRADWQLTPQLAPGLELVYSGTYVEESLIPNVAHQTLYRLDANLLVLDAGTKTSQVAMMTGLSLQQHLQPTSKKDGPTSVRLELARVDGQGRLRQEDKKLLEIPLKEPPTVEFGFFVPAPQGKVGRKFTWEIAEPGRPTQGWQVLGTESCGGVMCIKIAGLQQSADWDHVRADTIGWRRRDTLWVHPQLFVAQKVERIIEQRAAARDAPTARTVVKYELESQLRYPGRLFEERKSEAIKTVKFQEEAELLLRQPTLNRQLADALIHRIGFHLEHAQSQQSTPYRQAAVHIKEQLGKAKKGEIAVRAQNDDPPPLSSKAIQVGQRAPDFAASSLTDDKNHRLGECLGKPVLVFFYNPESKLGREVLAYAKQLSERQGDHAALLALAVTQDADLVRLQHKELRLTFPILDGGGLRLSYGATETPRFIVIDGEGAVVLAETGWGYHTPTVIEAALRQCQKR
jgi:peroxiredoxin